MATASKTTPAKAAEVKTDDLAEAAAAKAAEIAKAADEKKAEATDGDEFADAVLVTVEKPLPTVVPIDKIPESIRAHVALAVEQGPQVVYTDKWEDVKKKRYARLAKAITPHLPGGRKVKVTPTKHNGREAYSLSVYIPQPRKATTAVPPVEKPAS